MAKDPKPLSPYLKKRIKKPQLRSQRVRNKAKGNWYHPSKPGDYPHKDTGHLRNNIHMEVDRGAKIVRVGTNVKYGKYLEFGTKKIKKRSFIRRTTLEEKARLERIIGTGKVI